MQKQKITQKEWDDNPPPARGRDIIQVAARVHIEQLKRLFPTHKAILTFFWGIVISQEEKYNSRIA